MYGQLKKDGFQIQKYLQESRSIHFPLFKIDSKDGGSLVAAYMVFAVVVASQ
jgi:hypothetical protein